MAGLRYLVAPDEFDGWDFVHGLLRRCYVGMEGRIDPPSSLERMGPGDLRSLAGEGRAIIAVAEGPVGCAFLQDNGTRIYCSKLAVDPGFRRRGILRTMLALADEFARERGREGLELQTRVELSENHVAFRRLGFVECGRTNHPGYKRPTSITFRRDFPRHHPEAGHSSLAA
jgi:GNAT superfamily N-acetyltransferase